jgi:hypothetical protein
MNAGAKMDLRLLLDWDRHQIPRFSLASRKLLAVTTDQPPQSAISPSMK